MKLKTILAAICLLLGAHPFLYAQQHAKKGLKKGANISLNITDKKKTPQRTYFNLGLFSNYTCLNGLGINIISSLQHYNAYGMQAAGFANITGLKSTGLQIAGITNVTGQRACGAIFSGLMNVSGHSSYGLTVSGLGNVSGSDIRGVGISGLINVGGKDTRGVMIAGLGNVAGEVQGGLSIGGLMNVSGKSSRGVQITSLLNVAAETNDGWQLAGLGNVSVANKGLQTAVMNYSVSNSGLQLGIGNVNTENRKGVQIGIVNFSLDSCARQIGCINLKPQTRTQLIVSGGNANKGSVAVRFKNRHTYTQIGTGGYYLGTDKDFSLSLFYRAGVYWQLTPKLDISADFGYYHIESLKNKDSQGFPARMYALEPRVNLEYSITRKFGIFASGGYGWTRTYKGSHAFDDKGVFEVGMVLF